MHLWTFIRYAFHAAISGDAYKTESREENQTRSRARLAHEPIGIGTEGAAGTVAPPTLETRGGSAP